MRFTKLGRLIRLIDGQLKSAMTMADYDYKTIKLARVDRGGVRPCGVAVEIESLGEERIKYPMGVPIKCFSESERDRVIAECQEHYQRRYRQGGVRAFVVAKERLLMFATPSLSG